jgi:hypothetical protein
MSSNIWQNYDEHQIQNQMVTNLFTQKHTIKQNMYKSSYESPYHLICVCVFNVKWLAPLTNVCDT